MGELEAVWLKSYFLVIGAGADDRLPDLSSVKTRRSFDNFTEARSVDESANRRVYLCHREQRVSEDRPSRFWTWPLDPLNEICPGEERLVHCGLEVCCGDEEKLRERSGELIHACEKGIGRPVHVNRIRLKAQTSPARGHCLNLIKQNDERPRGRHFSYSSMEKISDCPL